MKNSRRPIFNVAFEGKEKDNIIVAVSNKSDFSAIEISIKYHLFYKAKRFSIIDSGKKERFLVSNKLMKNKTYFNMLIKYFNEDSIRYKSKLILKIPETFRRS